MFQLKQEKNCHSKIDSNMPVSRTDKAIYFVSSLSVFILFCSFYSIPSLQNGQTIMPSFAIASFKGLSLAFPMLLVLFATLFLKIRFHKNEILYSVWIFSPLFLMGFYGILSSLWSPFPSLSLMRSTAFLISLASCCAISAVLQKLPQNSLLLNIRSIICVSAIIGILIVVGMGISGANFFWRYDHRLGGDVISTNTFGALCGIVIGLSIIRLLSREKILFSLLCLVPSCIGIYLTYSRAAFVSLFVSLFLVWVMEKLLFTKNKRQANLNITLFFLFLCILFVTLLKFPQHFIELLTRNDGGVESIVTASSRSILWSKMLQNSGWLLLTGYGYAAVSETGFVAVGYFVTNHAHNGYLQVFLGTGIIGFFLFTWFLIRVAFQIRTILPFDSIHWRLLIFSAAYFIINNLAESSIGYQVYPQLIIFLLIMGPASAIFFNERSSRSKKKSANSGDTKTPH